MGVELAASEVRAGEERPERHLVVAPFAGAVATKQAEVGEWVETGSPIANIVIVIVIVISSRFSKVLKNK